MDLDPNDPFEAALIPMVETNRRKRADYAADGDPFSNFRITSGFAGFENAWLSALFNCQQKLARITALRKNGRLAEPKNEAVEDTLLDNAVYGVIALAIYRQSNPVAPEVGDETEVLDGTGTVVKRLPPTKADEWCQAVHYNGNSGDEPWVCGRMKGHDGDHYAPMLQTSWKQSAIPTRCPATRSVNGHDPTRTNALIQCQLDAGHEEKQHYNLIIGPWPNEQPPSD